MSDLDDRRMRCPYCKERGTLRALPANQMTRRPGYVCAGCEGQTRAPGSRATLVLGSVLGAGAIVLALFMVFASIQVGGNLDGRVYGAAMFAALGFMVLVWSLVQFSYPEPLDAPARPSRLWLYLLVGLGVLLALGAAVFGFFYFLSEMM